jgi:PEP-CTERM motif
VKAQGFILLTLVALGATMPLARANLVITPIYDPTIAAVPGAETAINAAISLFESTYSNNINVSIYFQAGGGLGQSNFLVYNESYTSFYNGLVANNANPAAIAALNANGGDALTNGGVNPDGGTTIEMKSANARAVGINQAPGCQVAPTIGGTDIPNDCFVNQAGSDTFGQTPTNQFVDGIISLNTSITNPPDAGGYDLTGVVEHEMDEVLGLGSAFENCDASTAPPQGTAACAPTGTLTLANDSPFPGVSAPQDLFRYNAAGNRITSINCATNLAVANFSYGPSTGVINTDNNVCNGGDFGDWAPQGFVQSAFGTPGVVIPYGTSEIDAMSSIGFGLTNPTPEPATFGLLGGSLVALAFLRRRLSRN